MSEQPGQARDVRRSAHGGKHGRLRSDGWRVRSSDERFGRFDWFADPDGQFGGRSAWPAPSRWTVPTGCAAGELAGLVGVACRPASAGCGRGHVGGFVVLRATCDGHGWIRLTA